MKTTPDSVQSLLEMLEMPLTRENYISLATMGSGKELSPEEEAEMPARFQQVPTPDVTPVVQRLVITGIHRLDYRPFAGTGVTNQRQLNLLFTEEFLQRNDVRIGDAFVAVGTLENYAGGPQFVIVGRQGTRFTGTGGNDDTQRMAKPKQSRRGDVAADRGWPRT